MNRAFALAAILISFPILASAATPGRRAVVVDEPLPCSDPAVARALADVARDAGYEVSPLRVDALSDPKSLSTDTTDLLILPAARSLPLSTIPAIQAYIDAGGHVVAAGLPAWGALVSKVDGRWLSLDDYTRAVRTTKARHLLLDFAKDNPANWRRASNSTAPDDRKTIDNALHVTTAPLTNWDTLRHDFTNPFPAGHTLTCFRAKGGPTTSQLCVEWQETDGSRWIATVNLTPDWQDYALPPEAFVAWQPPKGRGGPGDHLRPEHARTFAVGLAFSHTDVGRGVHEYSIADLGIAPHAFGHKPETRELPFIEGLSPAYQTYPMTDVATAESAGRQVLVSPLRFSSVQTHSLQPRPTATGFRKSRPWRWQPLVEATSPAGDHRGTLATLLVSAKRPHSVRLSLTPTDLAFYANRDVRKSLVEALSSVRRGTFLLEGGCAYYTAFEGQPIPVGARVARTRHAAPAPLTVSLAISPKDNPAAPAYFKSWFVDFAGRPGFTCSDTWTPTAWPEGGYVVTTELRSGDRLLDRLTHDLHVWRPKRNPQFVESRDGGFVLDGKSWKAHGLNYMPSSGVGLSDNEMFEHWIGAAAYDPVVIDRDLRRVKALGFNSVSVFIYRQSMEAQNLLDLLRRCDELDLKVNLSLRPGTPMDFPWTGVRELIEHYRLAQNDTVFAYDLAWEPTHWDHAHQQKHYAKDWQAWIEKRYGSLADAERTWNIALPPVADLESETSNPAPSLSVPPTEYLYTDGPHRLLAADYRLFLDDLLADRYGKARALVRSIDPHHAVSFRMNVAGDPTAHMREMLGYDFFGLRHAVDFFGPEGYGRIGDWDWVRPGRFTVSYARLCNPSLPVVWTEMGVSTWDHFNQANSPTRLEFAARFYAAVYRMLIESGSDGIFFWWYPGGYRANERSDFGLINPDGTDRPQTKVVRAEGPRFLSAPKPTPGTIIEIDRDADARGLHGVYQQVQGAYWSAVDAGRTPQLKWQRPPGSATAPRAGR